MYYCNNCDIAHEEKKCPLCEAKEEIKKLVKEIEELNNLE
jgi:rubrerythrin